MAKPVQSSQRPSHCRESSTVERGSSFGAVLMTPSYPRAGRRRPGRRRQAQRMAATPTHPPVIANQTIAEVPLAVLSSPATRDLALIDLHGRQVSLAGTVRDTSS
jgi:hypothetical protein